VWEPAACTPICAESAAGVLTLHLFMISHALRQSALQARSRSRTSERENRVEVSGQAVIRPAVRATAEGRIYEASKLIPRDASLNASSLGKSEPDTAWLTTFVLNGKERILLFPSPRGSIHSP
jgi:hypothetical protein